MRVRVLLPELNVAQERELTKRFGSVGNWQTREAQNFSCCGFKSHLSHCDTPLWRSPESSPPCPGGDHGFKSRLGRCYFSNDGPPCPTGLESGCSAVQEAFRRGPELLAGEPQSELVPVS